MYKERDGDWAFILIVRIALFIGVAIPIGILCWQALGYLQMGAWQAISVLDVMLYFDLAAAWVLHPTSWLELHAILGFLHAGLCGTLLAIIFIVWLIVMWG